MLVIVFIDFLFSAIIAVNGSAKVGVDTHKWFNPQIQFNPGMLHQKLIHPYFLLTAFILDGSYLQTKLMTDIDHRVIDLVPVITAPLISRTQKQIGTCNLYCLDSYQIKSSRAGTMHYIKISCQLPIAELSEISRCLFWQGLTWCDCLGTHTQRCVMLPGVEKVSEWINKERGKWVRWFSRLIMHANETSCVILVCENSCFIQGMQWNIWMPCIQFYCKYLAVGKENMSFGLCRATEKHYHQTDTSWYFSLGPKFQFPLYEIKFIF